MSSTGNSNVLLGFEDKIKQILVALGINQMNENGEIISNETGDEIIKGLNKFAIPDKIKLIENINNHMSLLINADKELKKNFDSDLLRPYKNLISNNIKLL